MKNLIICIFFTAFSIKTIANALPADALPQFMLGQQKFKREHYLKALKNFKIAKKICEKNKQTDTLLYVKINRRIGDCQYYLGNYSESIKCYKKALNILNNLLSREENKDFFIHKAHLFSMLGNVYIHANCGKAIEMYEKALKIYTNARYKTGIGGCYLNIGNCYSQIKDYDKAEHYFKKSLKFFKNEDYYSKSIVYSNLADIFISKKQYNKALHYLNLSNQQCIKGNRKRQLIFNYLKLGKFEKALGNCDKAIENFQKALLLAKKLKDKEVIRKSLLLISDCYSRKGDYKQAYLAAMDFIKNSKELFSKQLSKQLADIDKWEKTTEMKREIRELEKLSKKQQKSLTLHKAILMLLITFALGFIILLFQRQKLIKDIEKKNENLETLVKTIESVSKTDDLTGLPNRRELNEFIEREISRAKRQNEKFCFAICDLDNFKTINDRYSHQVGDIILMAVARMFKDLTRKVDIAVRFGGEEFVFVFTNTDMKNAKKACEKIRKSVEETDFVVFDNTIKITLTFGITEFSPEKDFKTLYHEADSALYEGKNRGKNIVVCYPPNLEK